MSVALTAIAAIVGTLFVVLAIARISLWITDRKEQRNAAKISAGAAPLSESWNGIYGGSGSADVGGGDGD